MYDKIGDLQLTLLFNVLRGINAIHENLIDIFAEYNKERFCVQLFSNVKQYLLYVRKTQELK